MSTVTLQIIVNNEIEQVRRILNNYGKYFDEVQLSIDDQSTLDTLSVEFKDVKMSKYSWSEDEIRENKLNFARKRNLLADQCTTDYYFTIDTDDEIINPSIIKEVAKEAKDKDLAMVYGYYIYSVDDDGNPNAAHWKERLVKNSDNLRWNKPIHENILPTIVAGHRFELDERLVVKHLADHEHCLKSHERNLKYLVDEYNIYKDKTDPRTIAYIGRTLYGLGDFKRARFFLEKHIELSGWDEDRYLSWCQLSDLLRMDGDLKMAVSAAYEALTEKPELPDAYLRLHDIYFEQEQWSKAIEWGEQGLKKEQPRNFLVLDPSSYTWRPALTLSWCYYHIGDFDKAIKLFNYAKKLSPSNEFVQKNEKVYIEAYENKKYIEQFMWLLSYTKDKEPDKVKLLVNSVPKDLFRYQQISSLRNKYLDNTTWNKKSVVIYCGDTPETWSPESTDKGIGGSEEAVIHMSKELTKLGYEVTVYNSCTKEGKFDGVQYYDYVRFNPKDSFNILISWRSNIFEYNIQGSIKLIWVHDIPGQMKFTEDSIKKFDKIIVLSKYHASLLDPIIPKEKIYISTNGINPDDFKGLEDIKREPHRLIYASSYDRGLELILDNWKLIRAEIPDAEIHCYYGFNTYVSYMKRGLINDDGWIKKMQELFKQPGVFDHGRVGHKELAREYCKSSILAYPCTYTGEINCIALTKAIACGVFPLTNDFAVMAERNTHGKVVTNQKFIQSLITLLRRGDTHINNIGYIEANSWSTVAQDWINNLFVMEIDTIVKDRPDWIWANVSKDEKLVDIGCNKGHMFDGWNRDKITSVDLDTYDIPNFVQANAQALPFKDNSFDTAVLAEIVEHTDNPVKTLSEARRVAKRAVITVPYEHEWIKELCPFEKMEDKVIREGQSAETLSKRENPAKNFYTDDGYKHLYHSVFYTPELLYSHLKEAGWEQIKIQKIRCGKWVWLGAVCTNQ